MREEAWLKVPYVSRPTLTLNHKIPTLCNCSPEVNYEVMSSLHLSSSPAVYSVDEGFRSYTHFRYGCNRIFLHDAQ